MKQGVGDPFVIASSAFVPAMLGQIHAAVDAEFMAKMVKIVDHIEGRMDPVALTGRAAANLGCRFPDIFHNHCKHGRIVLSVVHWKDPQG